MVLVSHREEIKSLPCKYIAPPALSAPSKEPMRRHHGKDSKKYIAAQVTSGQDGGVGRYTMPPCTTKRRTTSNLKTKNNNNCQKIKLYGSLTTNVKEETFNQTGMLRKKNMAQMKEQIKAPEKIQLSDKEINNLSDTEFKTLVIRMLTEMVEYGRKIEEKMKAMKVK